MAKCQYIPDSGRDTDPFILMTTTDALLRHVAWSADGPADYTAIAALKCPGASAVKAASPSIIVSQS